MATMHGLTLQAREADRIKQRQLGWSLDDLLKRYERESGPASQGLAGLLTGGQSPRDMRALIQALSILFGQPKQHQDTLRDPINSRPWEAVPY
jgi:hypothetical protein